MVVNHITLAKIHVILKIHHIILEIHYVILAIHDDSAMYVHNYMV
jgi:hypothetical protein